MSPGRRCDLPSEQDQSYFSLRNATNRWLIGTRTVPRKVFVLALEARYHEKQRTAPYLPATASAQPDKQFNVLNARREYRFLKARHDLQMTEAEFIVQERWRYEQIQRHCDTTLKMSLHERMDWAWLTDNGFYHRAQRQRQPLGPGSISSDWRTPVNQNPQSGHPEPTAPPSLFTAAEVMRGQRFAEFRAANREYDPKTPPPMDSFVWRNRVSHPLPPRRPSALHWDASRVRPSWNQIFLAIISVDRILAERLPMEILPENPHDRPLGSRLPSKACFKSWDHAKTREAFESVMTGSEPIICLHEWPCDATRCLRPRANVYGAIAPPAKSSVAAVHPSDSDADTLVPSSRVSLSPTIAGPSQPQTRPLSAAQVTEALESGRARVDESDDTWSTNPTSADPVLRRQRQLAQMMNEASEVFPLPDRDRAPRHQGDVQTIDWWKVLKDNQSKIDQSKGSEVIVGGAQPGELDAKESFTTGTADRRVVSAPSRLQSLSAPVPERTTVDVRSRATDSRRGSSRPARESLVETTSQQSDRTLTRASSFPHDSAILTDIPVENTSRPTRPAVRRPRPVSLTHGAIDAVGPEARGPQHRSRFFAARRWRHDGEESGLVTPSVEDRQCESIETLPILPPQPDHRYRASPSRPPPGFGGSPPAVENPIVLGLRDDIVIPTGPRNHTVPGPRPELRRLRPDLRFRRPAVSARGRSQHQQHASMPSLRNLPVEVRARDSVPKRRTSLPSVTSPPLGTQQSVTTPTTAPTHRPRPKPILGNGHDIGSTRPTRNRNITTNTTVPTPMRNPILTAVTSPTPQTIRRPTRTFTASHADTEHRGDDAAATGTSTATCPDPALPADSVLGGMVLGVKPGIWGREGVEWRGH